MRPSTDQLAYGNQVAPEYLRDARHSSRSRAACSSRPIGAARRVSPSSIKRTRARISTARIRSAGVSGCREAAVWRVGGIAFQLGEPVVDEVEIVGVIPDIKQANLQDGVQPAVYMPQEQWTMRKMAVVVRAENDDPAALIPAIRRELAAMDSTIPAVFAVYSDVVAASLARQRLGALVLVVFGLVSLTLAAVGTYGLIVVLGQSAVQRDRGAVRVRRRA